MMEGPTFIEYIWTLFFFVVLVISVWQWRVSVADARRKADEAQYMNGNTHAAAKLAYVLSYSVALDCIAAFTWMIAGTLSVFRYYIETLNLLPDHTLVWLLFAGGMAFGGRVVVRAYSRIAINKL